MPILVGAAAGDSSQDGYETEARLSLVLKAEFPFAVSVQYLTLDLSPIQLPTSGDDDGSSARADGLRSPAVTPYEPFLAAVTATATGPHPLCLTNALLDLSGARLDATGVTPSMRVCAACRVPGHCVAGQFGRAAAHACTAH